MRSDRLLKNVLWGGLIFVYLVILAGSVVRTTGSGMGCPDWPKCFDQWVPPTSIEQLPENYKQKYSAYRKKKVDKFSNLLESIGMSDKATQLQNDENIFIEEPFNAQRTWIEYGNRLVGFIAGNLFLLAVFLMVGWHRSKKRIFFWVFLNLIIISFNAWFGSIVVATNLMPWVITVHMVLAIVIILIQVTALKGIQKRKVKYSPYRLELILVWALFILSVVQVLLGTQVRQDIDHIVAGGGIEERVNWVAELGANYYVHRSFAWSVLIISIILALRHYQQKVKITWGYWIFGLVMIEVFSGIALAYGGFPRLMQPVHLLFSTVLLAITFWQISSRKQ